VRRPMPFSFNPVAVLVPLFNWTLLGRDLVSLVGQPDAHALPLVQFMSCPYRPGAPVIGSDLRAFRLDGPHAFRELCDRKLRSRPSVCHASIPCNERFVR